MASIYLMRTLMSELTGRNLMRICLLLFISLVTFSTTAFGGAITYETRIAFEDGLTDQLDRLNVGYAYEHLIKTNESRSEGFWDPCDSPDAFGISVSQCSFRPASYELKSGISGGGGWSNLWINLTSNIVDIQGSSLVAQTESSGRGSNASSLSGSFGIGFSDEHIAEILAGNDQGIRLGYGFSWIGFGMFDAFDGVRGQWSSLPVTGVDQLPHDLLVRSSFRTRITATSTDYSLQLAEAPKVILDETLTGAGEVGMTFPPDPASYGFTEGDIVSFRLEVEQRLWTERSAVKVSEPSSIALLLASLMGLGLVRFSSKKKANETRRNT